MGNKQKQNSIQFHYICGHIIRFVSKVLFVTQAPAFTSHRIVWIRITWHVVIFIWIHLFQYGSVTKEMIWVEFIDRNLRSEMIGCSDFLPDGSTVLRHHHCFLVQKFHPWPASSHPSEYSGCPLTVPVPNSFCNCPYQYKMSACTRHRTRMHTMSWTFGSMYYFHSQMVWGTIAHASLSQSDTRGNA